MHHRDDWNQTRADARENKKTERTGVLSGLLGGRAFAGTRREWDPHWLRTHFEVDAAYQAELEAWMRTDLPALEAKLEAERDRRRLAARAADQIRDLQRENDRLRQERADEASSLEAEIEHLKAQLGAARAHAAGLERELERARAEAEGTADAQRAQDEARLAELDRLFGALEDSLRSGPLNVLEVCYRFERNVCHLGEALLGLYDADQIPRAQVITELRRQHQISQDQYATLLNANRLRNDIIHNLALEKIDQLVHWTKWMYKQWQFPEDLV